MLQGTDLQITPFDNVFCDFSAWDDNDLEHKKSISTDCKKIGKISTRNKKELLFMFSLVGMQALLDSSNLQNNQETISLDDPIIVVNKNSIYVEPRM